MAIARASDPLRGFKFQVVSTKLGNLGFQKVSGLAIGNDMVEYREGTDVNTVRKLPGLATFDNVTFERGIGSASAVRDWMKEIVDIGNEINLPADDEFRDQITIILTDHRGNGIHTYQLREAWPVNLGIGDMDAESSDVIIETLEICHEGLSID